MPRVHFVKRARKPNSVVTKEDIEKARSGEDPDAASYFWWKFRYGGKHASKTRPRASQLTQSEYLSNIYGMQEECEDAQVSYEELESFVQEFIDRAQELADECREKRDNMPEGLQDSETGCLLEERADACETVVNELESIEIPEEDGYADETGEGEPDEQEEPEAHEAWTEAKDEWEQEKMEEVRSAVSDALGCFE